MEKQLLTPRSGLQLVGTPWIDPSVTCGFGATERAFGATDPARGVEREAGTRTGPENS